MVSLSNHEQTLLRQAPATADFQQGERMRAECPRSRLGSYYPGIGYSESAFFIVFLGVCYTAVAVEGSNNRRVMCVFGGAVTKGKSHGIGRQNSRRWICNFSQGL